MIHKHSDHPFRQACKGVFKRVERWLFVDRQWYFFGSSWYHLFFADLFERFSWLLFLGAWLFFWTIFLATLLKFIILDNFLGFLANLLGASSGSSSWLLSWTLLGYSFWLSSWTTLLNYSLGHPSGPLSASETSPDTVNQKPVAKWKP